MQKQLSLYIVLILAINLLVAGLASAQSAQGGVWRQIDDASLQRRADLPRQIVPRFYSTFELDKTALRQILNSAPKEFSDEARRGEGVILTIPMPGGTVSRFRIENSSIMEPELAAKYPEIQSYRGQGIDNPTEITRFDISPNGFRAMISSNQGTILIEPYAWGDTVNYMSFYKSDVPRSNDPWVCLTGEDIVKPQTEQFNFLPDAPEVTSGATLRTYRLAMAATGEYTTVFRQAGDTDTQAKMRALAAINTSVNRINQVYERDVAIRMILVANTDLVIYTDPTSDPYSNISNSATLAQNTTTLNEVIGVSNYDVGHVFNTDGGGVASLNGPCGGSKARGTTGLPNPVGDPFDIDFVAHEVGHQFGANHTFNSTVGGCAIPNRSSASSYEPGSGITIMAYAGLCGSNNLAFNSIDTFHVKSIEAIVNYSTNLGGNTCAAQTATGNTPPTVPSINGTSFNIPKQTPFALAATSTDANGDSLTYDWQQYDAGGADGAATTVPNSDADGIARPIFRPFLPTTGGTRTFPRLTHILNNANVPPNTTGGLMTGEILPAITRTMNFQVIVRDNRASGGGVNTAAVIVNVDGNSGPFVITAPNAAATWNGNSTQTVTWSVANTSAAPVNAANVKISLSTDGGQTFPTTLIESTPNDGTENITVPNVGATQARIKVEAVGNIFFDISAPNITINPVVTTKAPFDFDGDGKTDLAVFRPSDTVWYLLRSQAGFTATQFGAGSDKTVAADFDGDNKADIAVWRPATGTWYRLNSSNGTFVGQQFGANGDIPQPADFDGDGKDDLAVWRPTDGTWYRINSGNGQFVGAQFGANGDRPVAGDYDGDLKADLTVFRPSNGTWYRINSSNGAFNGVSFGIASDIVVPGDYDGDNKQDIGVFRPSDGTWYMYTANSVLLAVQFGANGDVPVPGDYDGDGKDDQAVYRGGVWYLNRSQAGFTGVQFGIATDQPVNARQ